MIENNFRRLSLDFLFSNKIEGSAASNSEVSGDHCANEVLVMTSIGKIAYGWVCISEKLSEEPKVCEFGKKNYCPIGNYVSANEKNKHYLQNLCHK